MIKIAALDVYGTMLCSDDGDWSFPPRRGLEEFLYECRKRKIIVATSSDEDTDAVKIDLGIAFGLVPERGLDIEGFDGFFRLEHPPNCGKDYSLIIGHYDIVPSELLVVDDRAEHIFSALRLGCCAIHCPEYKTKSGREWDFSMIKIA